MKLPAHLAHLAGAGAPACMHACMHPFSRLVWLPLCPVQGRLPATALSWRGLEPARSHNYQLKEKLSRWTAATKARCCKWWINDA